MVDRINNITRIGEHPRVDEARDSLEEEEQKGGGDSGEEGSDKSDKIVAALPGDGFDRALDRTNWKVYLDQPRQNQRQVVVPVEGIKEIRFLKINLKTNPSLLNVKVLLNDASLLSSAYVSVARHMATTFERHRVGDVIEASEISTDPVLTFFVADLKSHPDEEVTRVTMRPELTLSRTVKMILKKTWRQQMGLEDPETRMANREVILVYITLAVIVLFFVFAILWIVR